MSPDCGWCFDLHGNMLIVRVNDTHDVLHRAGLRDCTRPQAGAPDVLGFTYAGSRALACTFLEN